MINISTANQATNLIFREHRALKRSLSWYKKSKIPKSGHKAQSSALDMSIILNRLNIIIIVITRPI